jgi:hypothetical protein
MRHLGVIATGETPSAAEAADGLASLNDVLETWNIDGMMVYNSTVTAFTTVPNVASYTVGPTGAFVTVKPRPVAITGVYGSYQGVDYRVAEWTYDQYMSATVKATSALYPTRYSYVNEFPNGRLFLWPVPAVAITLNINIQTQLDALDTLADVISLPPGFMRALAWDLAAEIAPQYGLQLTAQQIAMVNGTKAAVKKANHTGTVSRLDASLSRGRLITWQGG